MLVKLTFNVPAVVCESEGAFKEMRMCFFYFFLLLGKIYVNVGFAEVIVLFHNPVSKVDYIYVCLYVIDAVFL